MSEEKRSVRVKGDQPEGDKKHGGQKNGIVADPAHEGCPVLPVEAGDHDHGDIVGRKEIG